MKRKKEKKKEEEEINISIETLEIEMTCITRQLEYDKLQLEYPENITHNSRRTSYPHITHLSSRMFL